MPAMTMILVKASFDDEAGVWFVESSDVTGLPGAATLEGLRDKLPGAILDLLEADEDGSPERDVPIELIAHASTRLRAADAA